MAKKLIAPRRRRRTAGLDYEALHRLHLEAYSRMISGAYDKAIYEAVAVAVTIHGVKPPEGEIFTFDKHPAAKKRIEGVMAGLQKRMQGIIEQGVRAEWTLANNKTDALVKRVYGKSLETMPEERKRLLLSNNEDAREAFVKRKEQGLGLSDKVWRYTDQFKTEIELGLDVGIRAGKSADELSRSLRGFLREPNKLFRRVRDEYGQLRLSARAKAYHPGQGVYRSSYKNALRLAATETNIAYRTADHERQQALDFVVGVEVHLSGNHTLNGKPFKCMCDDLVGKYPKDFKFTGWHPNCRCYTTPILKTPEEMAADTQKLLRGEPTDGRSVNAVGDVPDGFKTWLAENKGRIDGSASLPYFIRDNRQWVDNTAPSGQVNTSEEKRQIILERAKARHGARTDEQINAIRERWEIRRNVMGNSEALEGLVDRYKGDAPALASLSAKTLDEIKAGTLKGDDIKARLDLIDRKRKAKEAWDAGREVRNMADIFSNPKADVNQYGIEAVREAYAEASAQIKKWDTIPSLSKRAATINKDLESIRYNKGNKAWQIVSDAYERHLDNTFDKIDIEEALSDAAYAIGYAKTATDKTIKKLSRELDQIIDKPWAKSVIVEQKISELTAAVDRAVYVDRATPNNGSFTPLSDEEAMSIISQFSKVGKKTADNALRSTTQKRWQELTDKQRRVVTKYTETFSYLNERLRGVRYLGDRPQSEFQEDLPILTDILANTRTTSPMVVRRGVKNYLDKSLGKHISELKPGDEIVDYGFLSTSTTPHGGFEDDYTFVIAVPAGAQGIYAEPFSHYTDSGKFSYKGEVWNGSSVEELRDEMEWIGQRGSRMRVISVVGNTIHLILTSQGAHL